MRDHYRKTILPNIDDFGLTAEQKQLLRPAVTRMSQKHNGMTFI